MYTRNKNNKLLIRPEMFKRDNRGLYIICETNDQIEECVNNMYKLGIPWKSGEYEESDLPNMNSDLTFMDMMRVVVDDEYNPPKASVAILIGRPPYDQCDLEYAFGYSRIDSWESDDFSASFWRMPRIKFENTEWDFNLVIPRVSAKIKKTPESV